MPERSDRKGASRRVRSPSRPSRGSVPKRNKAPRSKRSSNPSVPAVKAPKRPSAPPRKSAMRKLKRTAEIPAHAIPEATNSNIELEPVCSSQLGGLRIAWKIALVTAILIAMACALLGLVVLGITTRTVENQINNAGIAMINVLERSVDRFWNLPEYYREMPDARKNWELSEEYKRRFSAVQSRLESLLQDEGSRKEVYNVVILGRAGSSDNESREKTSLVNPLKQSTFREVGGDSIQSPVPDVRITQLRVEVGRERVLVRKFEKDIDNATLNIYLSAERIEEVRRSLKERIVVAAIITILLGVSLIVALASFFTAPIRFLVHDVETVSAGDLDHKTPVRSHDEIGLLAATFDTMTRNLKIAQIAEIHKKSIEHELNIAKETQAKLLPERIPVIHGYTMHAFYRSAREVGGDYYDFIIIDKHHLGIIVADVSGKGIPASLVMTMTRSLIRLASHKNTSAHDTLSKVNRILAKDIRRGMFVTAAYMVLDIRTKQLKICSAGHNPLFVYRAATKAIESVKPKGMALGFDKGPAFDKSLEEKTVQLLSGDCLLAYTDGVVEAMDEDKNEYTEKRLIEVIKNHATLSASEFVNKIVESIEQHRGTAEQSDDITITLLAVD